ncbi:MAG: AMMECR1 domain-containing protein [Planctomycetota bacterium]|jgi:AMMECR1 domain-containing protein
MNDAQKETLLKVARDTVEAVVTGGPTPKPESEDAELNALCGCFVTLKNQDRLRGCIGQFVSDPTCR